MDWRKCASFHHRVRIGKLTDIIWQIWLSTPIVSRSWLNVVSMAASFYASPLIGATTTLACFAHEIPHEIADYSILIRSGFTKRQAMQSQFLTAIGAFVSNRHLAHSRHDIQLTYLFSGRVSPSSIRRRHLIKVNSTFIGIAVHTAATNNGEPTVMDFAAGVRQDATGLLGTTLLLADLVSVVLDWEVAAQPQKGFRS